MTEANRLSIFFYPAWYPHRGDSMFGLFVKRHAEAVKLYARVGVVFAFGENRNEGPVYTLFFTEEDGIPTARCYFRKCTLPLLGTLVNGFRFLSAQSKAKKSLVSAIGKPDVNHIHVLTRTGLSVYWQYILNHTPYLITEHWTRYLPVNKGAYKGFFRMLAGKMIVRKAFAVLPVSPRLSEAMQSYGLKNNNYRQVNNVVNTTMFRAIDKGLACKKWIHVSCFDEKQKYISGLLNGFAEARKSDASLFLTLVGEGPCWTEAKQQALALGLGPEAVLFTGILEGERLSAEFQKHDAFVLFSRYENQPVVIIEAFACGLPVLSTGVGSIPELLGDGRGMVIESEDVNALTGSMLKMAKGDFHFSRAKIRQYAVDQFSFEAVGKQLSHLYLQALEIQQK